MTDRAIPRTTSIAAAPEPASVSATRRTLRRIRRQPVTLAAIAWLVIVLLSAILAPLLAPYDPLENDFMNALKGPSAEHWLGTDENGRDMLSRILFGARIALLVGFGSVAVAMVIGVPIGILLGFRGGWTDRVGTRFVDVFDALPGLLVAFAVIAVLGRGLWSLLLAIGLMFCMNFARMARAITLAERSKLYVDAARVSGLRESAIAFKQVLPNLAGPLIVQAAILTGTAIIIESALSFLGIGLESSVPSWGGLLGVAAAKLALQPFMAIPPGVAIVLTVLAFNLIGDGLNDALGAERRKPLKRVPSPRDFDDRVVIAAATEAPAAAAIASAESGGYGSVFVPSADEPAAPGAQAPTPEAEPVVVDATPADPDNVLELRSVSIDLHEANGGSVPLVRDVTLSIRRGEIVGLLGESGSGKTMLAKSVLGLMPPGIGVSQGRILLEGEDITHKNEKELRAIRGSQLAAVFQDPLAALSPVHTIGEQLIEPLRIHLGMTRKAARVRAAELLDRVGVRDAANRLNDYPHQFSGGMAQRVAIALALAAGPKLVIADEATSALDVTTQAQVLDLLLDLRDEFGMAILLITHDLGVIAEACDRAAVMYAGEIVEVAEVDALFDAPRHPYTAALLAANPTTEADVHRLPTIPGRVPLAGQWPIGCHFASRCAFVHEECTLSRIPMVDDVRCIRADELSKELVNR